MDKLENHTQHIISHLDTRFDDATTRFDNRFDDLKDFIIKNGFHRE